MKTIIILFAMTACVGQSGPSVHLVYDQPDNSARVIEFSESAAMVWEQAGIGYQHEAGGTECAVDWYNAPSDCTITIHVSFVPSSEIFGDAGIIAGRSTQISLELTDFLLESTLAHEIGHAVWNASDHLAPDDEGIMNAYVKGLTTPTEADLAYADAHSNGWVSRNK